MSLDSWELEKIQEYFDLDSKINWIEYYIELLREQFYDQTMTTRTFYIDESIVTVGFNVEDHVTLLADNILLQENEIEGLKKKKRYFNDYLNSLDPVEKVYLINKYKRCFISTNNVTQADINLYSEIKEIEEAINFMNGFPPDNRKNYELDNDSLEDDFSEIAEMLGV